MHFLDGSIQTKLPELKASKDLPASLETSSLVQQPQNSQCSLNNYLLNASSILFYFLS